MTPETGTVFQKPFLEGEFAPEVIMSLLHYL